MRLQVIFLLSLFFLAGCGGRGVYLHAGSDPRADLDRPWIIIGKKGAGSARLERVLCEEKELWRIFTEAGLEDYEKEALFEAACGPKASAVRFLQIYYGLEAEKRNRVRKSFQRHGYSLNDYGC